MNMQVTYDSVAQQLKSAPEKYLYDISQYINYLIYRYASENQQNDSEKKYSGLKDFLGCLKLDKDPLEIQKEMRNEWN
ncbi:MAG: DUF2281 domain-containing protein [Bacteroidales bacterium]|nr:DUF2281 domain-containing protein [Bacteroidales bacterium]MBQ5539804.1 DUF2281 domain-containing protein [Bacteroidales bacterium]